MAALIITGKIRHALEMINEIIECVGNLELASLLAVDEVFWMDFLNEREAEAGYEWDDKEKRLVIQMLMSE